MQESAQSESSGYVPVSATLVPYSVSPHSTFESQRNTIDPQLLTMDYPEPAVFAEANESFFVFQTHRAMSPGILYSTGIPADAWSQTQGYHTDGTNPC
jgi:hypothetical protein